MYKALQNGWVPPLELSEDEYFHIKNNTTYAIAKYGDTLPQIRGVVGFAYSYAAKWFGGYCRGYNDKGEPRDYIREGYNNIMKQLPNIMSVKFHNCSYDKLDIPENSIIYCDPPYRNTTKYKDSIDYEQFYQWCRDKKLEGHNIFVSEYNMPDDFICVWEKELNSSLTKDTGSKKAIEKLFTL